MPRPTWRSAAYSIQNIEKYMGTKTPVYKSSWELRFMKYLDNTPQVIQWAYEPLAIPYIHPDGTTHRYFPDFVIVKQNRKEDIPVKYVVEIKPAKQTGKYGFSHRRKELDRQVENDVILLNNAKWEAANNYCKIHGMVFTVITEDVLLH